MSYDQANLDKLPRAQLESLAALYDIGGNHKKARIALDKLDQKEAEASEDRRHGEEMTAAAVSNLLARKALRRADLGIVLAALAIVVSLIAIVVSIAVAA